ncbi:MAG: chloramphenicol acetyltransferase [Chloroflexota bacterium]
MRIIDLETWPRRKHYEFFKNMSMPHFNLTANVDITEFYPAVKKRETSFTVAVAYILARVANDILEFRLRIQDDRLVEYEVVHPSTAILVDEDKFSFCFFEYHEDFSQFSVGAAKQIEAVKASLLLDDPPDVDKYLFMSSIPWVSFTSMMHPLELNPADSVPRIAWGKYFRQGDRLMMPLGVQAHHALMDGVHMGRYYQKVQTYLDQPELALGS